MAINVAYPYSPDKNVVLVNGVPIVGFADSDTAIEVNPVEDDFSEAVGLDGMVAVSQGTNTLVEVVLRLLQVSPSNDYLSGLRNAGRIAGRPIVAITVQNLLARDLLVAPQAWFTKRPGIALGRTAQEREWTFRAIPSVWNAGGSF